jgi:hypothetical protein
MCLRKKNETLTSPKRLCLAPRLVENESTRRRRARRSRIYWKKTSSFVFVGCRKKVFWICNRERGNSMRNSSQKALPRNQKNAFFKTKAREEHETTTSKKIGSTKTSTGKNNDIPRSAIFGGAGYSTFRRFHSRRRRRVFFCFFFVFFHLVPSRFGNRYERARPSLHVLEAAERVTDSAANNESV